MADYFPLRKGDKYDYQYSSSEFDGVGAASVIIMEVKRNARETTVLAKLTVILKGHQTSTEYSIKKTGKAIISGDGIVHGGRIEFPLPVRNGAKWCEEPDRCEIVSLKEKAEVPAGKFSGCLKVSGELEDGEGIAERFYAPGVGLVMETYNTPSLQAQVSLVSVSTATPAELKPKRKQELSKKTKATDKPRR